MPTQVVARPQAEPGSSAFGTSVTISPRKSRMSAKSIAYAIATLRAQVDSTSVSDAFVDNLAEQARTLSGAIGAVIALRQEESFVCVASSGAAGPAPGTPIDTQGGISGECIRSGKPLCCKDSENDPRVDVRLCRDLGLRSIAAVPVLEQGRVAGLVEVFAEMPNAFDDQSIEVLQSLATLLQKSRPQSPAENKTEAPPTAAGLSEVGWWTWPLLHPYQAAVVGGFLLLDVLAAYAWYHH